MNIICSNFIKSLFVIFTCCSIAMQLCAQQIPGSKNNFSLNITFIDKDSSFDPLVLKLQTAFSSEPAAMNYVNKLPALLATKGYPVASVDSSSSKESVIFLQVYLGNKYNWIQLTPVNIEKKALDESGFLEKNFLNKPIKC